MGTTDTITLNRALTTAAGLQASDLHFVVGSQPAMRVEGKLVTMDDEEIVTPDFIESVVAIILNDEQRQKLTENKEVVTAFSLNSQLRFKATVLFQRGSLAVTLHFISTATKSLTELGLPAAVEKFSTLTKGLVLVTGPYGSGRTTTLNALINDINKNRAANIITIEQPIEYLFVNNKSLIEQREVGRDALSYEQAIVAASKEDVDVVVVAEANGAGVISAMLEAAEASRLVISTMNTDSVLATIEKIMNSFPADDLPKVRSQLASVLSGIISQRLIPRVGGGQVVVADIMVPSGPARSVIRDGAMFQLANVLQTSREAGVPSLDQSLALLVKSGTITLEDAMQNSADPNALRSIAR